MSDNVIPWKGVTRLDIDPQRIISAAMDAGLTSVTIVGYDANGSEYFASSQADGADVLWALERAKFNLLTIVDTMTE